jgi:HEPN domain-containing protein
MFPKMFIFVHMEKHLENFESIVNHWKESSQQDYLTMQNLLKSKDFSWTLFPGHLMIEKLLKAHYLKKHRNHAIFTHDLLRLARKAELDLTGDIEEWLDEISTFNINARYDNYKQDFHKLCTKEFTELWIIKIENIKNMVNPAIIETALRYVSSSFKVVSLSLSLLVS